MLWVDIGWQSDAFVIGKNSALHRSVNASFRLRVVVVTSAQDVQAWK